MENDRKINLLNELLTQNYNAEKGYKTVAEKVNHPSLKTFCLTREKQRNQFGHDLKQSIHQLGGEVDKGTSFQGDLHRAWINVKEVVSLNNDEAMLEECVRGEKAALDSYQEAYDKIDAPELVRKIVYSQLLAVRESLHDVESLEKEFDRADS